MLQFFDPFCQKQALNTGFLRKETIELKGGPQKAKLKLLISQSRIPGKKFNSGVTKKRKIGEVIYGKNRGEI